VWKSSSNQTGTKEKKEERWGIFKPLKVRGLSSWRQAM
jgi:hypothetical protein